MVAELLTALALILVIEGALYALFPDRMKRMLAQVMTMQTASLRSTGLVSAVIGVGLVWLLRG